MWVKQRRIFEYIHYVDNMFRRSFLWGLSAASSLPLVRDPLGSGRPPELPSESSFMFWYHFYSAIQRDRPMSTDRARKKTVEELTLQSLTDDEAVRLIALANEGVYETNDMPERGTVSSRRWNSEFDRVPAERETSHTP